MRNRNDSDAPITKLSLPEMKALLTNVYSKRAADFSNESGGWTKKNYADCLKAQYDTDPNPHHRRRRRRPAPGSTSPRWPKPRRPGWPGWSRSRREGWEFPKVTGNHPHLARAWCTPRRRPSPPCRKVPGF